ncbi:acyl carrier protein, partial [Burkholderia pseudomallei]|nr:acyl carrier protein [Burkholderia pseudomallei]
LAPDAAFAALGALLAGMLGGAAAARQFAVCDVDWPRSPWRDAPIVEAIARGAPNAGSEAEAAKVASATNRTKRADEASGANGWIAASSTPVAMSSATPAAHVCGNACVDAAAPRAGDESDRARSPRPASEPARFAAPTVEAAAVAQAPAARATRSASAPDPVRAFLEDYVSRWDERLDLATLGLDSLDLAQMRNGFFKKFGVQIPLSTLASPTLKIGELARRMRNVAGIADE